MYDKNVLKDMIGKEGFFRLSDDLLERFLLMGEEIHIPPKANIIAHGEICKYVYITAEGVSKAVRFDGKSEIVMGFSGPGTITLSPIGYALGKTSHWYFQAVTDCVVLKVTKQDFMNLMKESHEFALWMFGVALGQLLAIELKMQMLGEGDVISNYKNCVRRQMMLDTDGFDPNRPNLLALVSSKDLASYLGITQSYLSNIRKAILKGSK